ncbi:hypothetical protein [Nonomuraea sp. NPDC049607]|uniref:hypothetical protein n=1 Tax=Nonomuraea sp. NPDC049607 TaxID=3154732 RepID=UPI00342CBC04
MLSREPMLRSRVFRRLPFKALPAAQVSELMRGYHPIYADADEQLLLDINDFYAHGTLRDWAAFTHTAAELCRLGALQRTDTPCPRLLVRPTPGAGDELTLGLDLLAALGKNPEGLRRDTIGGAG